MFICCRVEKGDGVICNADISKLKRTAFCCIDQHQQDAKSHISLKWVKEPFIYSVYHLLSI